MTLESQRTLASLAKDLAAARTTGRELVEECLGRIRSPAGEGARVFLKVHADQAVATADFHDRMRRLGAPASPYAGIPVSIKDLFDVAGDTTTAGSLLLKDAPAVERDAPVIARLKAAGFIIMGRTNMTEFAFSGVGLNPHYGTPLNPWDRDSKRIPGGSSSGAAVCISDAMAFGALGTDTGGSCRIPAALCGVVGYKPTAHRVPRDGTYPLSTTLDSIGPLAGSVRCCEILDAVLAGERPREPNERTPAQVRDLRLGVLSNYVTDGVDRDVGASYERALHDLSSGGAKLTEVVVPELTELADINRKGGISAAEAFAHHREQLATHGAQYDARVAGRILRGREQDAAEYIDLLRRRISFIERVSLRLQPFDAVLMPTTPIVAPLVAELGPDEGYWRNNALMLRNPSIINFLDGCAISLPCHDAGAAPVGLGLFGLRDTDQRLFAIAGAVEACLHAI